MTNINYKSLGVVLWKVLKTPLAAELTYEEAAEYALEFIKLLGAPVIYEDIVSTLDINMHKAELPCNVLYINGVKYIGNETSGTAMRESSDVYHIASSEENISEFTYKIQKGIIFTSVKEGCVQISYKGIAIDENGYPLIPDNEKVIIGMEYYILSRYLEPLWLMGKISDKAFEYIQQKRYFYTPSAFTAMQMPGVDKLETVMNGINRLIINTTAHKTFFKNYGEKEKLRQHK